MAGSGFCNKVPWGRWLINNRNVFLMVPEAGRLGAGCLHGRVLVRVFYWGAHFNI